VKECQTVNPSARDQFSGRLRAVLEAAGLSQATLARKLRAAGFERVGEPRVSEWCNGRALPRDEAVVLAIESLAATAGAAIRDGELVALYWSARGEPRPGQAAVPVPRELPLRLVEFTGRQAELARLRALLDEAEAGRAVVISAIDGLGGVGKSSLAIEAGWRLAGRFPDGQLYVDLQGSTVGLGPLTTLEALGRLLRSLGADPRQLPTDLDEAAGRLRSLTAGRRLLILLDNVRDAAQIRPLLPGGPSCAVLITSRDTLAYLDGVARLPLDVLAEAEALELLGRLAGPDRVQAEPAAARRLVGACGLLPLAVQLAGRRLGTRAGWTLGQYADQLADEHHRLDHLRFGDREVRGTFAVSYQALAGENPDAARAFRLLSLVNGPDFALAAAAALLDQPAEAAAAVLERLVDASLLASPEPGRYRFHDLLRLVARELAAQTDSPSAVAGAVQRVLGFYLATSYATHQLLRPGSARLDAIRDSIPPGGLAFAGQGEALAWLTVERANLLAAVSQAAASPGVPPGLAGLLADALHAYFQLRGDWYACIQVNQVALDAARRTGDTNAQAYALNDLGWAHLRQGRYEEAMTQLKESLATGRSTGNSTTVATSLNSLGVCFTFVGRYEEAVACLREGLGIGRQLGQTRDVATYLNNLSVVYQRLGWYDQALACHEENLVIRREVGDRHGQGLSLGNLGEVYEQMGRYQEALACNQESLEILVELGDRLGQATTLNNLGVVHWRLGNPERAVDCHEQAMALYREFDDQHGQAETLRALGTVARSLDRHHQARAYWQQAAAIFQALGTPEAAQVLALLADLPASSGPGAATAPR
jgi:tetratricopeptide (TPR) repeat protein/transcriptional regulator with XRE-family HTH domain